jgi:hypothetical protein
MSKTKFFSSDSDNIEDERVISLKTFWPKVFIGRGFRAKQNIFVAAGGATRDSEISGDPLAKMKVAYDGLSGQRWPSKI